MSRDDSDESPIGTPPQSSPLGQSVRSARLLAIVASVVGVLLTLSLPFLPVEQDSATLSWPQNGSTGSVEAPLVTYAPLSLDVQIPCSAVGELADRGGILTSTAPAGAADAGRYGLVARVNPATPDGPAGVEVLLRNKVLLSSPLDQLPADCALVVSSDSTRTTAGFGAAGQDAPTVVDGDLRPQMVGIFSDLDGAAPDGLQVTAQIDSRFSSTPSTLKFVAMVVGALATILALVALHRLDDVDGRRARRFLPTRWWSFGAVDAVVIGTLVLWHFIGASTSDDGYQFNMARTSAAAGYMANYFRWYGVPEAPFGSPYYDVLAVLANITPASPFVRLPALLAGVVAWLVISREVAPRLGAAVRGNRLALWTGGLVFLAFWLPYNNGLRPEPIVAVGVLLTWCSVERAVATRRLLPDVPSVVVFDTAYFHGLPEHVATYAIDRELAREHHIRRYGFHGTSHQYVSTRTAEFLDADLEDLNQIVLHLGNGASASAIAGGRPVETSMGLTPLEGLVMGTRSGDIDPGVVMYLRRAAGLDVDEIDVVLNRQSGLKGLCGENDFRSLIEMVSGGDPDATLAYNVYIHRLRKYVGAYMVTLGRTDTIVFTAGVGENNAKVRADALAGLENFGIVVDAVRNATRSREPRIISTDDSAVTVLVVPTNEELAIARQSVEALS